MTLDSHESAGISAGKSEFADNNIAPATRRQDAGAPGCRRWVALSRGLLPGHWADKPEEALRLPRVHR